MKVFKFDPATGRRGKLMWQAPRASWAASRWQGYTGHAPVGFGADAEVTVHRDSGVIAPSGNGQDVSYRHPTEWICYCLGCWHVGPDQEHWEWVVLPPANVKLED